VLGVAVGRALLPWLQSMSGTYFGPLQVRWDHVLGIAAFGLVSAFLAAVVPAWVASRQDVVAVLGGRRGDRAPSKASPALGVVLTAAGVVVAMMGAKRNAGELMIAAAAVVSILGMIFLVPAAVVVVARLARRFPLPLRYAVRDAARHRARTVPAVAAVAATVAGAVALSIANTSDQAQARGQYADQFPVGTGIITDPGAQPPFFSDARAALEVAGLHATTMEGARTRGGRHARTLSIRGADRFRYGGSVATLGTQNVVADHLPPFLPDDISDGERAAADAVLARGGAVLFSQLPSARDRVTVRVQVLSHGRVRTVAQRALPAYVVNTGRAYLPASLVITPGTARALSVAVVPTALMFDASHLDSRALDQLRQTIGALAPRTGEVYVERGYQVAGSERVVLWILFGLAGILMVGGTLTATFLALSDARPDLATLSGVGASPRMRRAVAAAYAVSVGVVGAVLGAAVGFIPGIAVSYPLTRNFTGSPGPSHYLQIPWVQILGLVVLLPVVTALLVGFLARSRLPLVARLD
jgi:putative ABC transport system permease protein